MPVLYYDIPHASQQMSYVNNDTKKTKLSTDTKKQKSSNTCKTTNKSTSTTDQYKQAKMLQKSAGYMLASANAQLKSLNKK